MVVSKTIPIAFLLCLMNEVSTLFHVSFLDKGNSQRFSGAWCSCNRDIWWSDTSLSKSRVLDGPRKVTPSGQDSTRPEFTNPNQTTVKSWHRHTNSVRLDIFHFHLFKEVIECRSETVTVHTKINQLQGGADLVSSRFSRPRYMQGLCHPTQKPMPT